MSIEKKAVDKNNWTALSHAAKNGYKEVCELLLEGGAKLDVGDYRIKALMLAAREGHEEVCELLLYKGLEMGSKKSRDFENKVLSLSKRGRFRGDFNLLKKIINSHK